MMSAQRNELITRTGPETPAGRLMRLYWQPAALLEELPAERPVKAIQLLGQHLVLFRDEQGRYGLVDRACPHRGADLAFGRLENGGLRCAFHGWLFDVGGKCLETPAEPEGSKLYTKIRHKAYPVRERNGSCSPIWDPASRLRLRTLIVSSRRTPHLRFQGTCRVQLAPDARSWHRSRPCFVPASFFRGPRSGGKLWNTVSQYVGGLDVADDENHARISEPANRH